MSEHREWLELAAGHALDALDPEDRERFESHLPSCERCRAEIEQLGPVTRRLARAADPVEPPAGMRARVLEQALGRSPAVTEPAAPSPGNGWRTAALAASLAAIAALGTLWNGRLETARLRADLDDALEALRSTRAQVTRQDALLGALVAPDVVTATLAASGAPPSARVFWNRDQGVAVLTAFNLPAAAAGRTYQLWAIDSVAGTPPVSLGTFDSDGSRVIQSVAMPAGAFDVAAVTDEPAGGSPQPTTQPFLVGNFATQ